MSMSLGTSASVEKLYSTTIATKTIIDSTSTSGTPGQILSSSPTGIVWTTGSGGTQDLQAVTNIGATTTNQITIPSVKVKSTTSALYDVIISNTNYLGTDTLLFKTTTGTELMGVDLLGNFATETSVATPLLNSSHLTNCATIDNGTTGAVALGVSGGKVNVNALTNINKPVSLAFLVQGSGGVPISITPNLTTAPVISWGSNNYNTYLIYIAIATSSTFINFRLPDIDSQGTILVYDIATYNYAIPSGTTPLYCNGKQDYRLAPSGTYFYFNFNTAIPGGTQFVFSIMSIPAYNF